MQDQENQKTLKSAFYIRVSTEEQVEKYGMDLQKVRLRDLVASRGTYVDGRNVIDPPEPKHIYEEDISGTTPLSERPEFRRLQEDIMLAPKGSKPFDIVIVYKIDRFARKLKILLDVIEFFENNDIQFISALESIDTSTPFGRAMLGIMGVIAELEVENIRERTHAGKESAINKGVYMAKPRYGYKKDSEGRLQIFEREAKLVQRIFSLYVDEKYSINRIRNTLSDEMIPIPSYSSNKSNSLNSLNQKNSIYFWQPSTIANILRDEIYTGKYYFNKTLKRRPLPKNKWKLSPYNQPQIIDDFIFEKAQTLLANEREWRKPTGDKHLYLLRGLLKCDGCYDERRDIQGRVTWHGTPDKLANGKESFHYICQRKNVNKSQIRCTTLPLPAEDIENYIVDFILDLIKNPKSAFDYQKKLDSNKQEFSKLTKRIDELNSLINVYPTLKQRVRDQHMLGELSNDELTKKINELNTKQTSLSKELLSTKQKISKNTLSNDYLKSLRLFGKVYKSKIKYLKENREDLYSIIHTLVEEIVVISRPVNEKDIVAGRKIVGQKIPYKLHIKLKLPQEYLEDLFDNANAIQQKEIKNQLAKLNEKKKYLPNENEVRNRTW